MPLTRTTRSRPAHRVALYAGLVLLFCGPGAAVQSAPVPNLYSARVATDGIAGPALEEAFARALAEVLVRATGRRSVAADPAARSIIAGAGALVRQYQPLPGGQLRVEFDAHAVRTRLDAANLPVWGDDRPVILLWVAVPAGSGPLLVTEPAGMPPAEPGSDPGSDPVASARQALLTAAALRGLAVVLPAAGVMSAEGGDFVAAGEARAEQLGAEGVLAAQPATASGPSALGWTLALAGDRQVWQGDLAEGMHVLADRLAARHATAASSRRKLQLAVLGILTFEQYGQVQRHLRTLDLVERIAVDQVVGDAMLFTLAVRGDAGQLRQTLSARGLLAPVTAADGAPAGSVDAGIAGADLRYRFVGSP